MAIKAAGAGKQGAAKPGPAKAARRKTLPALAGSAPADGAQIDVGAVGRGIMGQLMGPDYLKRREGLRNSFNGVLQDYSEEVCFGRTWSRPGIPHKLRSILNIAMLVALNRNNQLRTHVEGALNNGVTVAELQEILLHAAVYAGLPAATDAFKVAEDVLRAKKLLD